MSPWRALPLLLALSISLPHVSWGAGESRLQRLWSNDLAQSFFNEWVREGASLATVQKFMDDRELEDWLDTHAVVASPAQIKVLQALHSPVFKGWLALRSGAGAIDTLKELPKESRWILPLTHTAALELARNANPAGALRLYRSVVEPSLEARHYPNELAEYYLERARLEFQLDDYVAAREHYGKIPVTVAQFLRAREELAWIYILEGDTQLLRGEIASLNSPLLSKNVSPDVIVLKAMSDLELCFFDQLDDDFTQFQKVQMPRARAIDEALKARNAPRLDRPDAGAAFLELAQKNRETELKRLDELARKNPSDTVWSQNAEALREGQAALTERLETEYRRQWKNEHSILTEAILKMHFVKVEYLSRVRALAAGGSLDHVLTVQSSAGQAIEHESNRLVFPVHQTVWSDELFGLRAVAQEKCAKLASGRLSGGKL